MKFQKILQNPILMLMAIFILAFFLRSYLLSDNLFYGPEQGRDMLVVKEIVSDGNFTLIGPRTEVKGIFYGPFYYYLMSIPFVVNPSPVFLSLFLVALNSLGVLFIYFLGKELFGKRTGLIAALLYGVSFWVTVSDRWLSHPPLAIVLSILFVYSLVRFLKGDRRGLILAAISFSIAGQLQIFSYPILGLVLFSSIIIFWQKIKNDFLYFIVFLFSIAALSFTNIILFDFRHDFLISNSILNLLSRETGFNIVFSKALSDTILNFSYVLHKSIFPVSEPLAIVLLGSGAYWLFKEGKDKFRFVVLIWLASPIIFFSLFRHMVLDHYFMSVIPAFILTVAFLVDRIWSRKRVVGFGLFVILLLSNFLILAKNIPINRGMFFQEAQFALKYKDQKEAVKYIYDRSGSHKFYYQAYTIPYWLPQAWDYLFWYFGNDSGDTNRINSKAKLLYVIIQDDPEHLFQSIWLRDIVSKWGAETNRVRFGSIEVRELQTLHEE